MNNFKRSNLTNRIVRAKEALEAIKDGVSGNIHNQDTVAREQKVFKLEKFIEISQPVEGIATPQERIPPANSAGENDNGLSERVPIIGEMGEVTIMRPAEISSVKIDPEDEDKPNKMG